MGLSTEVIISLIVAAITIPINVLTWWETRRAKPTSKSNIGMPLSLALKPNPAIDPENHIFEALLTQYPTIRPLPPAYFLTPLRTDTLGMQQIPAASKYVGNAGICTVQPLAVSNANTYA